MKIDSPHLKALEEAGIKFYVEGTPVPGGAKTFFVTAEDLSLYLEDKDEFAAKQFGVPVEDYLEWVETEGTPRCGAKTAKGKRCKNFVSGGIHMNIHTWRELDGGYCAVHGGESAEEARGNRY